MDIGRKNKAAGRQGLSRRLHNEKKCNKKNREEIECLDIVSKGFARDRIFSLNPGVENIGDHAKKGGESKFKGNH